MEAGERGQSWRNRRDSVHYDGRIVGDGPSTDHEGNNMSTLPHILHNPHTDIGIEGT